MKNRTGPISFGLTMACAMIALGSAATLAEFRYCSMPYPNQTFQSPQGCWRHQLSIGSWTKVPITSPETTPGNSGSVVVRCNSQSASDSCYDVQIPSSQTVTPTCNRTQIACGSASVYFRAGIMFYTTTNGFFPPPTSGYQTAYNAPYSATSTFDCNNVFWLQATGSSAPGVNCSTTVPGIH